MPALYAIDTNLYIRALRDAGELSRLKRFLLRAGTRLRLAGVVALELRAGAKSDAQRAAVESLLAPYAARDRVITPSFEAFVEAGRVLAAMAERERLVLASAPPSLRYDALLAASCREAGAVLLTANRHDFARVKRYLRASPSRMLGQRSDPIVPRRPARCRLQVQSRDHSHTEKEE